MLSSFVIASGNEVWEILKSRQAPGMSFFKEITNGKLIVDQHSGHNIHLEDPETIIHAVEEVLHAYETRTKLK
ncbi:MAG TPA: hypothetical protein VII28_02925 [Puia sp.]